MDITLKPLSDTRWEAKIDSVKAVRFQLGGILDALEKLEESCGDGKLVSEAKSLSQELTSMEFLVCLVIWQEVLTEVNFVSKALQAGDVSMDMAIRMICSLKEYMVRLREEGFVRSVDLARKLAVEMDG